MKDAVVVCSGSGIHFPVYFGAFEALVENGYLPKVLCGASGGALAASIFASLYEQNSGYVQTVFNELKKILSKTKLSRLIHLCPFNLMHGYLYDREGMEKYLEKISDNMKLGDIKSLSLSIIATDIDLARAQVFTSETHPDLSLAKAVMASSAIPLVFEPVAIGNSICVDGGTVQDVPYEEVAKAIDGRKFALFPESGAMKKSPKYSMSSWDILKRSADVFLSSADIYQLNVASDNGFEVVLFDVSYVSSIDFSAKSSVLLQEWDTGYKRMSSILNPVK